MTSYDKPILVATEEQAEAVYAIGSGEGTGNGACNSKYMKGEYHVPNYGSNIYINRMGCIDCPCNRNNSYCALTTEGAYEQDNGNRLPAWEKQGHDPYERYYKDWDQDF